MIDLLQHLRNNLDELLAAHREVAYICRSVEALNLAILATNELLKKIRSMKAIEISQNNNDSANACLACEFIANACIAEIQMLLALKNAQPHDAWDWLIDAQCYTEDAYRAHNIGIEQFGNNTAHLLALEGILFPGQVFLSNVLSTGISRCSICSNAYGSAKCDHLEGIAYLGRMCQRIFESLELKRVDFVEIPKIKKHRLITYTSGGKTEDLMTGLTLQNAADPTLGSDKFLGSATFRFPLE